MTFVKGHSDNQQCWIFKWGGAQVHSFTNIFVTRGSLAGIPPKCIVNFNWISRKCEWMSLSISHRYAIISRQAVGSTNSPAGKWFHHCTSRGCTKLMYFRECRSNLKQWKAVQEAQRNTDVLGRFSFYCKRFHQRNCFNLPRMVASAPTATWLALLKCKSPLYDCKTMLFFFYSTWWEIIQVQKKLQANWGVKHQS